MKWRVAPILSRCILLKGWGGPILVQYLAMYLYITYLGAPEWIENLIGSVPLISIYGAWQKQAPETVFWVVTKNSIKIDYF